MRFPILEGASKTKLENRIMNNNCQKKIVLISNYAWTVFNFRLPLIQFLRSRGFHVVVLTQYDGYEKKIRPHVDDIHNLLISRRGMNPFFEICSLLFIGYQLYRLRPHYVLAFTIKPVLYSSLVSKVLALRVVPMITGLGTSFLHGPLLRSFIIMLYRWCLNKSYAVIFQNTNDRDIFISCNIIKHHQSLISPGSGIDLDYFQPQKIQLKKGLEFLFVGRLIKDKGIKEFLEMAKMVKGKYSNVTFKILGPLAVENRSALSGSELEEITSLGFVTYLGDALDVRPHIAACDCVVLPSYREGMARVLIEAGALGRLCITSNVTGCRDIIIDGFNGFLCEPRSVDSLVVQVERLICLSDQELEVMRANAVDLVKTKFDQKIVFDIYENILK